MADGDLHTLLAALISHHRSALVEDRREIYHTPLLLLLGGLLGKAGHLAPHPWSTQQQWECCSRWWRSCGNHRFNTSHVMTCSFFISSSSSLVPHLADFFESCRSLRRWTDLFYMLWALVCFLTLSSGHSPLWWRYRRWKPLHWSASDPPLPLSVSPPSPFW
jgi:hypothetical protein